MSFVNVVAYLCSDNFQLLWKKSPELFTQLMFAHSLDVHTQSCPVPVMAQGSFPTQISGDLEENGLLRDSNYNMVVVGSHRLYHTSLCQVVSPQGISIMLSVAHPKIPNCTVFLSGHTAHPGIVQQLCQTVWCRLFWYSQHLCWLTCACPSDGCWESADGLSPRPQQWHISLGCSNSV